MDQKKHKKTKEGASQQEEGLSLKCNETLQSISINPKQIKENSSSRQMVKRKKKQRQRQKKLQEVKGKAIMVFQSIIKEIYQIGIAFESVSSLLAECFLLEENSNLLYNQLYQIIRSEIDLIRHKIISDLVAFKMQPDQEAKTKAIKSLFKWIWKIQRGSPEVEKVLNLFIRQHFCSEDQNFLLNANLDIITLQFIYKQELLPSPTFLQIEEQVRTRPKEFQQENRILDDMIEASQKKPFSPPSPLTEQDSAESDSEEQIQPQSPPERLLSEEKPKQKKKAKRPEQLYKSSPSLQEVMKRTEEMTINEDDRANCNVEESWLEKLRSRKAELWKNPLLRP